MALGYLHLGPNCLNLAGTNLDKTTALCQRQPVLPRLSSATNISRLVARASDDDSAQSLSKQPRFIHENETDLDAQEAGPRTLSGRVGNHLNSCSRSLDAIGGATKATLRAAATRDSKASLFEAGCSTSLSSETQRPTERHRRADACLEEMAATAARVTRKTAAAAAEELHKPVGLVISSAYILGAAVQLSGVAMSPVWLPVLAGGALGGFYAALNRAGMKRFWRSPSAPLNVVVTGGAKGIGKALAREFLRAGDRVLVTSRTAQGANQAVAALREEVGPHVEVCGAACDVSDATSVAALVAKAQEQMGVIDVWVNNAGYSGSFQPFLESTPSQLGQVVRTNLVGALLCTRAALRVMQHQPNGGHIFNMDGAGADGMPTPQYAAYGATKAGITQLLSTLQHETSALGAPVAVHNLSPGMVLTDLLLEGATEANKKVFNILCEQPETVAAFLVPRARTVVARGQQGQYIRYLTLGRALARFITAPARANRFFNQKGEATYLAERERILGDRAKATERLARRASRRSAALGFAYSLSIAASYLMFVMDALQRVQSS